MVKDKKNFFAGYLLVALLLLFLFSISFVSAGSFDEEFKKIANYASEYEIGNIDYVQLLLYSSAVREKMNELLGATGKEAGGVLKQEQIKQILGESIESTKWVWVEGEEKEKKLDNEVPVWKKIIFDGKKIQIRLNAWPSIFSRKNFINEDDSEKIQIIDNLEGKLVYRLNFEIVFKKPEEQLNIQSKIENIKTLAENFNTNPSSENADNLAKESVNAERTFESHFRQSSGKCEDVMAGIFGTENKRQTQQMIVQEINFCEGDNFEVVARLEMCDDCEWSWINLNFNVEGRGPGFKMKEEKLDNQDFTGNFEKLSSSELEGEIRKTIEELKQLCISGDYNAIMRAQSKLWPLNEALNKKSNDVWKELDKSFQEQINSMSQEERMNFDQNYGWIKLEQEKKKKAKEMTKANYELRKQFYLNLFSGYESKSYSFSQIEFQKRLVEQFMEKGEEICNNNQDDNQNQAIDCADEQCGGKICGKGKNIVVEGNESKEMEVDFYCIESECKAREEIKEIIRNVSNVCPELPAIECSEGGKVFFSRYDNETNCPMETSCLEEKKSCQTNEDCAQPMCGLTECVENKCEVTQLTECRETECVDGEEQICETDGRIVKLCSNGLWENIGNCSIEPEIREEVIVSNECLGVSDCDENNICNNGVCQQIPNVVIVESEEEEISQEIEIEDSTGEIVEEITQEETEERNEEGESQDIINENSATQEEQRIEEPSSETSESVSSEPVSQPSSESEITGNVIFKFAGALFAKISLTGKVITGFQTESSEGSSDSGDLGGTSETSGGDTSSSGDNANLGNSEIDNSNNNFDSNGDGNENRQEDIYWDNRIENPDYQNNPREERDTENERREDGGRIEEDDRRTEENQRMEQENKERCTKDCARPCIEKCIRTDCGQEMECNVDETQKKCAGSCEVNEDCVSKCLKGGDWWKEFENKEEHKQEKGVFQVGGSCRTNKGKTEGFIWFGGWGEPFEQIQFLKNKYYSGGQADWCKFDFENLRKQREEFEKGFNQEFVVWFFEKYLTNSAENWEQAVSGIFELYWKDVDNSREMAYRMQCLEKEELPAVNLINVKYNTEYGSIEFWEEIKTVKLPGMDKEMQVISPYMKAWVFPPKEFIVYEMKKSMKNHEFPGSPEEKMERKNEEGPTAEEKEMIKKDEKFMEKIREISGKYGGNLDIAVQFKDYETNNIVFNLYAQVNENDIMKLNPMPPEEIPSEDIRIEIDFKIIYNMIYDIEKEIRGEMIESPPWDRKMISMRKIKEIKNGITTYFKMRKIIGSAKITPIEAEKDAKALFKSFMSVMKDKKDSGDFSGGKFENDKEDSEDKGVEEGIWESKEAITGQIILKSKNS